MNNWKNVDTKTLLADIVTLENPAEAEKFFRDLLTPAELVELGKRWKAAQLLDQQTPYTDIIEMTGLSSTTVARISKWLKQGMGGYRLLLDRTHHTPHSRKAAAG